MAQLPMWMQDDRFQQRVVNFILLSASFGYALYTILNIDHGITRGWTHNVSIELDQYVIDVTTICLR
jgi:hypothetical protein